MSNEEESRSSCDVGLIGGWLLIPPKGRAKGVLNGWSRQTPICDLVISFLTVP